MILVLLMLFNLALIIFAFGYGLIGIAVGRMRLTRSRTLRGGPARFAGVACVVVAVVFWWFSATMWSLVER